jgi:hypothetical protein
MRRGGVYGRCPLGWSRSLRDEPRTQSRGAAPPECIPLPIPHTKQVTPQVTGRLHQSNGRPSSGVSIALTASAKDTARSRPAIRTTTDAADAFQVPFTEERKGILWLTLMENPGGITTYWLGASATDPVREPAHRRRTYIVGHKDGDTLQCLDWVWKQEARVTCNTEDAARMLVGGTWVEGVDSGTYRVILAEDDRYASAFRGFVQWIVPASTGRPDTIRAITELPVGPQIAGERSGPTLAQEDGRWYLTVLSTRPTKWGNKRWLRFELGPPGQVRQVQAARN